MRVAIYCFDKGLFIKEKFVKTLRSELSQEFEELENGKYVRLDKLLCKVDNDYDSYFSVYEQSTDLDKLITVLIKVSKKCGLHLTCTLSHYNERDMIDYIRERVKGENINIRASVDV